MMIPVDVEIFGKKYRLKGDDADLVKKYADFLNMHLNDINSKLKTIDLHTIFSFTAMLITEKYFIELNKNKELSKEIERLKNQLDFFMEENKF